MQGGRVITELPLAALFRGKEPVSARRGRTLSHDEIRESLRASSVPFVVAIVIEEDATVAIADGQFSAGINRQAWHDLVFFITTFLVNF